MAQIRFSFFKFLRLALLTGLAVFFTVVQTPQALLAKGIPQRWETKEYQPPGDIGAPTRVLGGGTRSSGSSCPIVGKPLKALIPSNGFGVTVAAYPTFFVYMPALSLQTSPLVQFVLEDKQGNNIYTSTFKTSGTPGIMTISLPSQGGLSPMEVGKDYKWYFSLMCQPDERSQDITVEGWVRRVEPSPVLKTQLMQASLQQQVELYAESEIWHDALATLAQLRRNNLNDPAVANTWANLLRAAGLDDLAQELLMPIPSTARRPLPSLPSSLR
jgi:hypothetical protein